MVMVLGLTGAPGSGKDTFADILEIGNVVARYSFARPVYEMLEALLGQLPMRTLPNGKEVIDKDSIIPGYGCNLRHMLRTLGTGWGREMINDNIWVYKADEWYRQLDLTVYEYVIFTDVRYDNEAAFVKALVGDIIHIVNRDAIIRLQEERTKKGVIHSSDDFIAPYYVDYNLHNSTLDLQTYTFNIDTTLSILRQRHNKVETPNTR